MKLLGFAKKALSALYKSIRRFPATIFLFVVATIMLIIINELSATTSHNSVQILIRITCVIFIGIPITLFLKFIFERSWIIRIKYKILSFLMTAVFMVLYYYLILPDMNIVSMTRYFSLSAAFYLATLFIPYFFRKEAFELYIVKIVSRFFSTILFSIVLVIGLFLILFTIDNLFGINISWKSYYYVWLLIAGIFAPCYFLTGVPEHDKSLENGSYPLLLKILLLYIVMPLISIYTLILYAYFIKIIITLKWPVGLVAQLVLWYSLISICVIFLSTPHKSSNKWAKFFIFLYPIAVLPLLIMMFISVLIRVNAYGITENRYFVVIAGLWVLGIMLYCIITKVNRNILIPITLSIVLIFAVAGPLSAYSVSEFSQSQRLENILKNHDMLIGNKIVISKKTVSASDKKEVISILNYFNTYHKLSDIRYLSKGFKMDEAYLQKTFGFGYPDVTYPSIDNFYYYTDKADIISINGYDYMFNNVSGSGTGTDNRMQIIYNSQTNTFSVLYDKAELYKKNLSEYAFRIDNKYSGKMDNVPLKDMTFTDENEKVKIKFIFINLSGTRTGKKEVTGMNFYALINIK